MRAINKFTIRNYCLLAIKSRPTVFTGIMNADGYVKVLENTLLPFLRERFADKEHRFMEDNDPKHVSRRAKAFFEEHNINWWRTPAESPDMNPIENLWHELKEHLRARVKPRNLDQLVEGIVAFWGTVDTAKCCRYIGHLRKVIPKVIELEGDASGYWTLFQGAGYAAPSIVLFCVLTNWSMCWSGISNLPWFDVLNVSALLYHKHVI